MSSGRGASNFIRSFVAGWLISNISCVLSLAYLYRLGAAPFDEEVAQRACIFLLLFQT